MALALAWGWWAWWVAAVVTAVATIGYALLAWRYSYWRRRGVPAHRPLPLVGSFLDALLLRKTVGEVYRDIYRQFPEEALVGYFKLLTPALLVRDPALVEQVLVTDFSAFKDNDVHMDRAVDPMFARSPFTEKGDRWKLVRSQLTSTFTAARMRGLDEQLQQTTHELAAFLHAHAHEEDGVEVKQMAAMAATDAVGLCMLGVRANALRDRSSEFGAMTRFLLDAGLWDAVYVIIFLLAPALAHALRIRFVPEEVAVFFRKVVGEATEARRKAGTAAPDYLQLSMALRDKHPEFVLEDAAAHACMFFMDGFEPLSTAMALALLHLADDPLVQDKAEAEVREVLASHGGKLNYDSSCDMHYIDMVVCETMRMYPPLRSLDRLCTRPHALGGVRVEPGTPVVIPVHALHHDPRLYPDPARWDPQRFTEEARAARPRHSFLPFGAGPRVCVGQRYAMAVLKLCVATALRDFRLLPVAVAEGAAATQHDVRSAFYFAPRGPLRVRFQPRQAPLCPAAPSPPPSEPPGAFVA